MRLYDAGADRGRQPPARIAVAAGGALLFPALVPFGIWVHNADVSDEALRWCPWWRWSGCSCCGRCREARWPATMVTSRDLVRGGSALRRRGAGGGVPPTEWGVAGVRAGPHHGGGRRSSTFAPVPPMIRLVNQFDEPRRRSAVAHTELLLLLLPGDDVDSASLTVVHVDRTAVQVRSWPRRTVITVASAISVVVAGVLSFAVASLSWGGERHLAPAGHRRRGGRRRARLLSHGRRRPAGGDPERAFVVLATMVLFAVELLTIGFFFYGQFLALPVAIVAALWLHHRMQRAT